MKKLPLSLLVLFIAALMLLTSCGGQTNQVTENTTPISTPEPIIKAAIEDISVNIEKQDLTDKGRKVVVWIENLKENTIFDGSIHILGDGKLIDSIFPEGLLAHTKTYGIIFDKSYANEYTYEISGSLKEVKKNAGTAETNPEIDIEYNKFYELNNQFGKTLYIQVPNAQKEYVVSVCKAVKAKYPTENIYINFYTKDDNIVQNKPPFETGASQSFAYYSSGSIIFYDTSEVVELK